MSLKPGARLGAYEVLAQLGAGGMGEVYRAHDPRLEREIALKILPIDVARDPIRLERFSREARILAALNHPNIVAVYSTEQADGVPFFTMELVHGRTLEALIAVGGIAIARFFEIAVPLTDALTAAHQKGITHRDLKPANVIVNPDGHVKVLDFGLATPSATACGSGDVDMTAPPITAPGMVIGTLPYMSPEQVEGKAVDHRSDLFSLGIMFYELLTGRRPFTGASSPALMSSILKDSVAPISGVRADVPASLSDLVNRCLHKHPDHRVQTARDVYNELRQLQREVDSAVARQQQSSRTEDRTPVDSLRIGVGLFTSQGTADAESVAPGLTEEIRSGLSRFSYLSVLAGGVAEDPRGSGAASARYVVEGSVRGSAHTLRITARLVDIARATHLWSDTYERSLQGTNALAVQDDITDRIVATVADVYGVLMQSMTAAVGYGPLAAANNSEVRLRYWRYHRQHTAPEHAQLRDAMEAVAMREPTSAPTWAALAHLYCHETMFGFNSRPDSLRRARQAATRAMDLDVASQHAWEALAVTCFFDRDRAGFVDAAERAMVLNPRNTNTAAWIGTLLAHMGEHDRGIEITDRAIALNPYHPRWYHFAHFVAHYDRGNFTEALRAARRVNMPEHLWSQFALAVSCGQLGLVDEGQRALGAFFRLAPELAAGGEDAVRYVSARWKWSDDVVERYMDGFRKALASSR